MEESILTSVILPASLFIIMLGMGLSLELEDFKRIGKYPKAVSIGLFNQLIILPVVGFVLSIGFALSPSMAVGLMIIAACPGGVTSNLIAHVAKGDTALSISLTAISSFITVLTIPFILSFSLDYFFSETRAIELPILRTVLQIIGITILPVSIGMFVRARNLDIANRLERPARIASTIIFVVIVLGIIWANKDILASSFGELGAVTITLNIVTMAIGFATAKLFRLDLKQTLSVAIESGIQNGTLAIVIATAILLQPDLALAAGIYSLVMFGTGGILMWYFGRKPDDYFN